MQQMDCGCTRLPLAKCNSQLSRQMPRAALLFPQRKRGSGGNVQRTVGSLAPEREPRERDPALGSFSRDAR